MLYDFFSATIVIVGSSHFKLSSKRHSLTLLCIYYYCVYTIEYYTDEKGQSIDLLSGSGVVGEHDAYHEVADIYIFIMSYYCDRGIFFIFFITEIMLSG